VFLGRDWIRSEAPYSSRTGSEIDAQVRRLAVAALEQALAVLRPRRELMDRLVERLIAEETISGESFRSTVERWEAENPQLALSAVQLASVEAGQAAGKADVEAAQVGV
jgi:cell division protease FtsH